jgi:signal transduction histidine kinase
VKAPAWVRSIRFRLTLIYSVALFAVGAIVMGVTYLGLRSALDEEPVSARLVRDELLPLRDGSFLIVRAEQLVEFNSVESQVNERALEQLRQYSFIGLGAMFVLSLGVGWVVAGRVLRPIDRISAVARDITATDLSRRIDLHGPEDELTRLASTFDDMLGRLDGAFESQRRFIHEASHELRNPLATIRTNIEVALADPSATADELRQTAEVVDRSADRMGRVVDDLLAYARSDVPEREDSTIDLTALVAEVLEEFAGPAEAAAVHLRLNAPDRIVAQGDVNGVRRLCANLLANAIEHAPSGTEVTVSVTSDGSWVKLEVEDGGRGVGVDDRDHVFQRAWRGRDVSERRPSGSGLGLTIVRQVARAHGGDAWVETASAGTGARFTVTFLAHG